MTELGRHSIYCRVWEYGPCTCDAGDIWEEERGEAVDLGGPLDDIQEPEGW